MLGGIAMTEVVSSHTRHSIKMVTTFKICNQQHKLLVSRLQGDLLQPKARDLTQKLGKGG